MRRSVEPMASAFWQTSQRHFGVHDDLDAGVFRAHRIDMLGQKALMDRAMALPQDDFRSPQPVRCDATVNLIRVEDDHLIHRDAHGKGGVAAEVLIGQEEDLFGTGRRPTRRLFARWTRCKPGRRALRRRP